MRDGNEALTVIRSTGYLQRCALLTAHCISMPLITNTPCKHIRFTGGVALHPTAEISEISSSSDPEALQCDPAPQGYFRRLQNCSVQFQPSLPILCEGLGAVRNAGSVCMCADSILSAASGVLVIERNLAPCSKTNGAETAGE